MKIGDQLVVSMGGHEVAYATIEDISDGKATVSIPATRVVFGVQQSLAPLESEVDREFAGGFSDDGAGSEAEDDANTASLRDMNLDSTDLD